MRKEYVKPVMESEEFISNEYVAACYTVRCTECGAFAKGYDSLASGVKTGNHMGYSVSIYTDNLGGTPPCITEENEKTPSWVDEWWEKIIYYRKRTL